MRRVAVLSRLAPLALGALGMAPVWSQPRQGLVPPPPLPPPPSACVIRYGQTGCAARLYAQLLCDSVGHSLPLAGLQQELQARFEEAGLRFVGIGPAEVESAAVRYYAPQLCPAQAGKLHMLYYPPGPGSP